VNALSAIGFAKPVPEIASLTEKQLAEDEFILEGVKSSESQVNPLSTAIVSLLRDVRNESEKALALLPGPVERPILEDSLLSRYLVGLAFKDLSTRLRLIS
jgi:hypothetical protein